MWTHAEIAMERRRKAIDLYYEKGWTMQQIAQALGISCARVSFILDGLPANGYPKVGRPKNSRTKRHAAS